jgi:hypothetical protein
MMYLENIPCKPEFITVIEYYPGEQLFLLRFFIDVSSIFRKVVIYEGQSESSQNGDIAL